MANRYLEFMFGMALLFLFLFPPAVGLIWMGIWAAHNGLWIVLLPAALIAIFLTYRSYKDED